MQHFNNKLHTMATSQALKICLVGPSKVGKTLLARALADQPIQAGDYQPTAAVRIQTFSRTVGVDNINVQLWDCSGGQQYQHHWPLLAKDLDGIIMVVDAQHPEQEKDLESFYMSFAQPHSLTIKQCLIMAIQVVREGSQGLIGFGGLQGKLNKLSQTHFSLNPASPAAGLQDAYPALDKLLSGCWTQKKYAMEQQAMGEPQEVQQDQED